MTEPTKKANFRVVRTLASTAVAAVALAAISANAQGTGGSSTGATGAAGVTSSGAPRTAGSSAAGNGAMVSRDDSKLMTDLAQGNISEIETGKMALEKSQNDTVKKFAQHMVDDHTAALTELQALAQAKGVKLPDGTDIKHKTMAAALKLTSGNTFDTQYMKSAGVGDHQQTIELLKKTQKNAKDAELKAMATKMLPTVQDHLKMAQQGVTAVSAQK